MIPRSRRSPCSMWCFSGISSLGSCLLLDHVIDFSSGWSDSLSLHLHLDDLVLLHSHGFSRLAHLIGSSVLEDFEHGRTCSAVCMTCLTFHAAHFQYHHACSQLVRRFTAGSCLHCVFSTCCVMSRTLLDPHHLWHGMLAICSTTRRSPRQLHHS